MGNKWRPEGWDAEKSAHEILNSVEDYLEDEHTVIYEAGADAMLHAVLKGVLDWLESGEYKASGLMLPAGWGHELYGYFGNKLPDNEVNQ